MLATCQRLVLPCGVLLLLGCQADFGLPPNNPPKTLSYPPGGSGDLPTVRIGASVQCSVRVTDSHGKPVKDIGIAWDDGLLPSPASPDSSVSNDSGYARTVWTFRPRVGLQALRAYLPGANGNPVEYRAQVLAPIPQPPPPAPSGF